MVNRLRNRFARTIVVLAVLEASGLSAATSADAHPLHTSYSEVAYDQKNNTLTASVHVFTDDFTKHVAGPAGGPATTTMAERRAWTYLSKMWNLTDARGAVVPLSWCGWEKSGDMLVICVKASVTGGLAGVKVRNSVMMDVFDDQLNILQGTYNSARHSLLFTRSADVKLLL